MNVAWWCCHLRRERRVGDVRLQTHCNSCMDVAWAPFWEIVWARNLVFSPCKVAPAGDERYLGCAAGADRSFWRKSVPPLCSAKTAASYVRSSIRFFNPCLQIAVEWLHECCLVVLPCA